MHNSNKNIAPLEIFEAPDGLEGCCQIENLHHSLSEQMFRNDKEVVLAWLEQAAKTPSGKAGLRSAAEKILNWTCFEKGIALSKLTHEDLIDFVSFMSSPRPIEKWISSGGTSRRSANWRPFQGALSGSSQLTTLMSIRSLFNWMRNVGYAQMPRIPTARELGDGTSWLAIGARKPNAIKGRPFTLAEWRCISQALDNELVSSDMRVRLVTELLYFADMSLTEVGHLLWRELTPPSVECSLWRIQISSRNHRFASLYALPPLSNTLSTWFGDGSNQPRQMDDSLVVEKLGGVPLRRQFLAASSVAEQQGLNNEAESLALATPRMLRGALHTHASEHHQHTIWQLLASARSKHDVVWQYAPRHAIPAVELRQQLSRIEYLWLPSSGNKD